MSKFQITTLVVSIACIVWIGWHNMALASEYIDVFDVVIEVNEDATIDVTERIDYDFGSGQRHGIYREIPVSYQARGGKYKLRVEDVSVVDEADQPYQIKVTKEGQNMKVRVGDPDEYVTGKHTYIIKYSVGRAINYFDTHDELYWNVTGDEWPVGIGRVAATVALPITVAPDQLQAECFAGGFGDSQSCAGIAHDSQGGSSRVIFQQSQLEANEGLTIVVGVPKGILYEPTVWEQLLAVGQDNWVVVVPVITLAVLLYLWRTRGRDPAGRGAIVPQYDPPEGLTPAQVGTIVDEDVDSADMTADIIHLAVNGYIKIHRIEVPGILKKKVDYRLEKLRPADGLSNKVERELMGKLFEDGKKEVKLSKLKNEFYKDWEKIRKLVYESVVEQGYFPRSPRSVRNTYLAVGVLVGVLGVGLALLLSLGAIGVGSMVVTGGLVLAFSSAMPAKTKKGALTKERILGLKHYLSVAEKERLAFHNAPEKNPEQFDKLLPFAMALGVEKAWAKQFEGIYREQPTWYSRPVGTQFNAAMLASNMGSFSSTANSTLSSRPSSAAGGGSGFSGGGGGMGGGFGGGGGGSW